MAVPNIFGTATAAIPLSQLDTNFATAITLGNTAVYLGNTTTSLGNLTLTNVTISSGTSNITTNVATVTGTLPEANGGTGTTTGYYGFKNRIINGAMGINQRGFSGAPAAGAYTLDRWSAGISQASKFTVSQTPSATETGFATRVGAGFTNYLGATSSSAYSVLTGDFFFLQQQIEGFNVSDLAWGTANAKTVTLSFLVYSSLTGTFGGAIRNQDASPTRSYPFSYTISSANTWTQISVTIAGDTSGTWATNNTTGMSICFGLGVGTTYSGTAGAWAGANYVTATGATSVVGTNGATFYITGVQLEKGSTATSFDYRPYGTELQLCQRYYWRTNSSSAFAPYAYGSANTTSNGYGVLSHPVPMRTIASSLDYSLLGLSVLGSSTAAVTSAVLTGSGTNYATQITLTSSAAFTTGFGVLTANNSTSSYVGISAEL